MQEPDVDEIQEVIYPENGDSVEVIFKGGLRQIYDGADLPRILELLNHWTPPTA